MNNKVLFYDEAKAAGHSRYQGSPCKRGHDGVRHISGGQCVACQRLARRSYYHTEQGRKKQIEHVVAWQKRNPDKYRRYQTAWRRKQTAKKCADQVNAGICPRKHCPMRAAETRASEALKLIEILRQSTLSSELLFEALIADGFTARELFTAMHSIANAADD